MWRLERDAIAGESADDHRVIEVLAQTLNDGAEIHFHESDVNAVCGRDRRLRAR
jgi:hypothetical protein